ncbi:MAG: DUF1667 domain-containing protein [Synergistaceae bacterium]|jgi:CxxC motif-containing protein|nr:DUF1667 domain-containing protein [Synergistaceae bacterium]
MSGSTIKGEFLCVVCPNGCILEAEYEEKGEGGRELIFFAGNRCARGEKWVRQEIEDPMRTISSSILVRGGDFPLASVRTTAPIPLTKVRDVMDEIRKAALDAPLYIGQVVLVNPAGAETNIIVTRGVAALRHR